MLDYTQIDYIIRRKNFCLWKITDEKFDIIKNEHGTYGEYFDFIITVKIVPQTYVVKSWKISNNGTSGKEYIQEIEGKIKNIMREKEVLLETMCFEISDKL